MGDIYTFFRELTGSWGVIAMFAVFLIAVLWAFRPGSGKTYKDVADIPFRHEDKPAGEGDDTPGANPEEAR